MTGWAPAVIDRPDNPRHSTSQSADAQSADAQNADAQDADSQNAGSQNTDELMPEVYAELHRLAKHYWRGQPAGHTLQPTAIVHEAYLRLVAQPSSRWRGRTHFCATAATAMRHLLVDHARARRADKRGGLYRRITLDENLRATTDPEVDVLDLDDALTRLNALDPRKSQVVELRFFGGLNIDETAEALGISHMTVSKDWRFARAWILNELEGSTIE